MVRFIADDHAAKLARWLRLLGYDTLHFPEVDDERLAELARREGRIVVTRDTSLARRFPDIEDFLAVEGVVKHGRVGSAPSILISGRRFRDSMIKKLQQDATFLLRKPVSIQVWCGATANYD